MRKGAEYGTQQASTCKRSTITKPWCEAGVKLACHGEGYGRDSNWYLTDGRVLARQPARLAGGARQFRLLGATSLLLLWLTGSLSASQHHRVEALPVPPKAPTHRGSGLSEIPARASFGLAGVLLLGFKRRMDLLPEPGGDDGGTGVCRQWRPAMHACVV